MRLNKSMYRDVKKYYSNSSQHKAFTEVSQSNQEHLWLHSCINEYRGILCIKKGTLHFYTNKTCLILPNCKNRMFRVRITLVMIILPLLTEGNTGRNTPYFAVCYAHYFCPKFLRENKSVHCTWVVLIPYLYKCF